MYFTVFFAIILLIKNSIMTNIYQLQNINLIQMKKKIYNNVSGLGYPPFGLNELKQIINQNPTIDGNHHITNQIQILQNTYKIPNDTELPNDISLKPLSDKLLSILLI